jgi:hypothetical protein
MWAPERVRDATGLSHFQRRVEAALVAAGWSFEERRIEVLQGGDPDDLYVTGLLARGSGRLYLYVDGLELRTSTVEMRLEDWDVNTPDEMIERLLAALATVPRAAG